MASSKPVPAGIAPFLRMRLPRLAAAAAGLRPQHMAPTEWLARIGEAAEAERERWALWLPVGLGAGIGIYFALQREPSVAIGLAGGAAGLVAAMASFTVARPFIRATLAVIAALLIGFGLAKWRTETVSAPVVAHRIGPSQIVARVEWVQLHGKGVRVLLQPSSISRLAPARSPRRVRLYIRSGGERLRPDETVKLEAVLLPPPPPAEPGDYDFGRAAFFQGIGAVGYAYGSPKIVAPAPRPGFFARGLIPVEHLRWRISKRIHDVLPGSTGAIAAALIAGDRGGISDSDEQALRDAGLAHVLAIAGLHMALVGLGLFWAVRALLALVPAIALTQPIKKWAAAAALAGAAFYLVISGAATPATRAFVMLAMMLTAIIFDRPALSMRSLAFAAAIILFMRPESLIEPGFQMSFAAVGSLIAVAEWERMRASERSVSSGLVPQPVRRYLRGIAVTSFVGSIATMPYAAFHFDRATHYAVLGNLLAMPIMGFLTMPAAAIAIMLMPLHLDVLPLRLMGLGIEAMLAVGRWVSHLPGSVSNVAAWPVSALIFISIGGLWIVIWRRPWRWLGLTAVAAGALLILAVKPSDVLVARDGETAAVRAADGRLYFVRAPTDEYSASEWLKRDGDTRSISQALAGLAQNVRCDTYACVAMVRGTRISFVRRRDALAEDCARADIVVSAVPLRHACHGPQRTIDRFDVSRQGAHAVWLGDSTRVETVSRIRGDRPWSLSPHPARHP